MTSSKPLKPYQTNFETLQRAFKAGDVCLVACTDQKTGELVPTICMVNTYPEDREIELVPVAKMFTGNPYEEVIPPLPTPEGVQ